MATSSLELSRIWGATLRPLMAFRKLLALVGEALEYRRSANADTASGNGGTRRGQT